MNETEILKVDNIGHTFVTEGEEKTEVLKNISFSVNSGEFFTILGPSGCGKSTLLRILTKTVKQTRGTVNFSDISIKESIAAIFQSFAIFPWLTVYENVGFGLKMSGVPKKEMDDNVHEHIKETGLIGFENMYPKDLSGGMKQRVGIARALTLSPKILLMDEPFSSLDAFTADKLRQEVLRLWSKDKMTIIMVTHLVDEAVEMSDRILVMTPRPGQVEKIVQIKLARPRNKRSQDFFEMVDKLTFLVNPNS